MTGIPVPETLAARILLRQSFLVGEQSRRRKFVLAIAASVLLVIGIFGFSAGRVSEQALALDIVAHVHNQPHYPRMGAEPGMLPADALHAVGAYQVGDLGEVLVASVCEVQSRSVAHLVLSGENGPVAVVLVPDEKKVDRIELISAGANTTLIAIRGGTIGIVGVDGDASTALESKLRAGLRWQLGRYCLWEEGCQVADFLPE